MSMDPIRTLSLFSGAGGLDLGFHQAGFQIVEAVEIDQKLSDIMRANIGEGKPLGNHTRVRTLDIRDYETDKLGKIDWIIGGPPCQTFSSAGRRANGVPGVDDPRGLLFEEYAEIVRKLQPRGFLYENVHGLVGAQEGKPWRMIKEEFSKLGYGLFHRVLDSADYGAPQHRERLILVGLKQGEFQFPLPLYGPDSISETPHLSAKKAISSQPRQAWDGEPFRGKWGHLLPDIPPGLNYSFYTSKLGHPNPVFAWRSKFSDFLYKADPDRPVRTIKAQAGQYTGPLHWENRHFTTEELKLLQSFPPSFQMVGSETTVRKAIGNSVPPSLANALAEAVLIQVFGHKNKRGYKWHQSEDKLSFRARKRKLTEYYHSKAKEFHENSKPMFTFKPTIWTDMRIDERNESVTLLNPKEASPLTPGQWDVHIQTSDNSLLLIVSNDSNSNIDDVEELISFEEPNLREPDEKIPVRITMMPNDAWDLPYSRVVLWCNTSTDESLIASFRAIKLSLKMRDGIDDLVQLNGYYQQLKHNVKTEISLGGESISYSWQIASAIASSELVGKVTDESHWKAELRLESKDLHRTLKKMKLIGYDIRDSATNPQIPYGAYLVCYHFPSLTKKSVQSFKPLRK